MKYLSISEIEAQPAMTKNLNLMKTARPPQSSPATQGQTGLHDIPNRVRNIASQISADVWIQSVSRRAHLTIIRVNYVTWGKDSRHPEGHAAGVTRRLNTRSEFNKFRDRISAEFPGGIWAFDNEYHIPAGKPSLATSTTR